MSPLTGVIDAAVIIGLAKGEIFPLLASLYTTLYIPRSVREEIIVHGRGRPGQQELGQALGVWITEVTVDPAQLKPFSTALSTGDREVLAVAALPVPRVDHVLADDKDLLREANRHGFTCLRTPDLVLMMKLQGLIPRVRPVLDRMTERGYGIASALYATTLQAAGE